MAKLSMSYLVVLLLLATSTTFTTAGRTLLDIADDSTDPPAALATPATTATAPAPTAGDVHVAPISSITTTQPVTDPAAAVATQPVTPAAVVAPKTNPTTDTIAPVTPPITTPAAGVAPVVDAAHHPALTFYMHDILGGSNPSARVITGIISNPAVTGQLPFARSNGAVFPNNNPANIPNGNNNGVLNSINNNNVPFLTGLGGQTTSSIISNTNGAGNIIGGFNGLPFFNAGQMPAGYTIQKLLFGTMTVIDDVLTEGHELGSGMVGKAQGFYVASSEDGLSQTMAFTAMLGSNHYGDSLCLFGVHKVGVEESQLAVMGGTGKYVKAKGFASVKTMQVPAVATDGAETLLEINVYLA